MTESDAVVYPASLWSVIGSGPSWNPRTKGQSLNKDLFGQPCYRPGFVAVRPSAMNAFFTEAPPGERVYAVIGPPTAASKSMSRDQTAQMIRASLFAMAIAALL